MKFAIAFANTGPFATPEGARTLATAAEEMGFESLWTVEHVVVPEGYQSAYPYSPDGKMPGGGTFDIPDPLVWLTYVGAVTSTIKLATGILIVPQRNPVVLAKEVATLDALTGGRVELGIGVGWLEEEFDALGVPFAERGTRTDEYVAAMRTLWSEEKATFKGQFVEFEECWSMPKPAAGAVPIHVGGHSDAAARRAGRLGDGFFPGKGSHEELARSFDLVRETATAHGRDPDAIEFTSGGNGVVGGGALDEIKALADLGVHRVIVPAFLFWGETREALGRYSDEVIAKA